MNQTIQAIQTIFCDFNVNRIKISSNRKNSYSINYNQGNKSKRDIESIELSKILGEYNSPYIPFVLNGFKTHAPFGVSKANRGPLENRILVTTNDSNDFGDFMNKYNLIHRRIEKYIYRRCSKSKPLNYPINNDDIEYNIFLGIYEGTKFTDIHGNIVVIKDIKDKPFDLNISKIRISTFHEYKYFFEIVLLLEKAIIL